MSNDTEQGNGQSDSSQSVLPPNAPPSTLPRLTENIDLSFDIMPLIESLADGTAVVYVGAGASIPANLPSWKDFLQRCLTFARQTPKNPNWSQIDNLLNREGDYLTSADLLQREIGASLEGFIWKTFGGVTEPSPIHLGIARLPFSLAITTNYDRLLESAFPTKPNVWTWRDPQAVFAAVKHRRFCVVKIHGDVGNGASLVLTKTQYRDLMHLNKSFNDCLTMLLSLYRFVFIGSSLRDHDLLRLMDAAKLTYGADFGPHYAVLLEDEVSDSFRSLLQDAYSIQVITCRQPKRADNAGWETKSVCSLLNYISGMVAKRMAVDLPTPVADASTFSFAASARDLLRRIVHVTGSDRGQIAFSYDWEPYGLHLAAAVSRTPSQYESSLSSTAPESPWRIPDDDLRLSIDGELGQFYLSPPQGDGFAYSGFRQLNVEAKASSDQQDLRAAEREIFHSSHYKSALTTVVKEEGLRVGALRIEARAAEAFTEDHVVAIQHAASLFGSLLSQYRHRRIAALGIAPYLRKMKIFQKLMGMSRILKDLQLNYILYELDYASGNAFAKFDSERISAKESKFSFAFTDRSIAMEALRKQHAQWRDKPHDDALKPDGIVSPRGLESFAISGPVFATPIWVRGSITTILVCWSGKDSPDIGFDRNKTIVHERIQRLATLIASSTTDNPIGNVKRLRSYEVISIINSALLRIDNGMDWTPSQLARPEFRTAVVESLMKCLVHPKTGIQRARLWVRDGEGFVVMSSRINKDVGKLASTSISVVGFRSKTDNLFPRVTERRVKGGECRAKWQSAKLSGQDDPDTALLQKDPNGSWIIGPIDRKSRLVGFVATDNHLLDHSGQPKEKDISDWERAFQVAVVDLVTDILRPVVAWESASRRHEQAKAAKTR